MIAPLMPGSFCFAVKVTRLELQNVLMQLLKHSSMHRSKNGCLMQGESTSLKNLMIFSKVRELRFCKAFLISPNKMVVLSASIGLLWTKLRLYALMHVCLSPGGNLRCFMQYICTTARLFKGSSGKLHLN